MKSYDLIILGGGPAGLTAAIYGGRAKLKTLVLEKALPGGQLNLAWRVENFPGFPQGISGMELGKLMKEQAEKCGAQVRMEEVISTQLAGREKIVRTTEEEYQAKAVIIATGASHRHLNVPGEERLLGMGVSYCALCDAPFFQGKEVAVIGGGDSAVSDALYLAQYSSKVYLIHRRHQLRATPVLQERVWACREVRFIPAKVVREIKGEQKVEGLVLADVNNGQESFLPLSGVFVAIGTVPNTALFRDQLELTNGLIKTNEFMETTLGGVFACGDVRFGSARQAITAAAEGAQAAISSYKYIRESLN